LLVFGLLAASITLLLVAQAVARQMAVHASDYAGLRALGASRGQLVGICMFRAGVIGVVGGVLAVALAAGLSPLMPFGLAGQAEIHPGFSFNPAVLLGGAALIAGLVVLSTTRSAWTVSRQAPGWKSTTGSSTSKLVEAVAQGFRSPSAAVGVRYGLERGRGRAGVPVAGALVAAILAVAAVAASLTFASSLSRLEARPGMQGWNWDVLVGDPNDSINREPGFAAKLANNPLVGSYSAIAVIAGARQGNAYIGHVALDSFLAFDPLKGSIGPTLIQGRAPQGLDEIVLGSSTLEKLHKHVGQTVEMDVGPPVGQLSLHIVGSMIAPSVGDIFTNSLGDGAWISGDAFRQVQTQMASSSAADGGAGASGPPQSTFGVFAVRYAPGVSPAQAFASLQREFGPVVLRRLPPGDVLDLQTVDRLPLVLAGLLSLLGLASIGHTLISSVRRRQHELAVLKTIGFERRQVAGTVAWQATVFVVVALAVGLPVGAAIGRWVWNLVASGISSVSPPVVPILALALMVPVAVLLANLLATGPGWAAARVAPARVLRSE
jgi:hypothetical protein